MGNQNTVTREECEAILKIEFNTEYVGTLKRLARAHLELLYEIKQVRLESIDNIQEAKAQKRKRDELRSQKAALEEECDCLKAKMCILAAEVDSDRKEKAALESKLAATLAHFDNVFGAEMHSMLGMVERDSAMKQQVRTLESQLAEARKDTERMNDLEIGCRVDNFGFIQPPQYRAHYPGNDEQPSLRGSIDAAGALRAKPEAKS